MLEITRVAITKASISGSGALAGPDAALVYSSSAHVSSRGAIAPESLLSLSTIRAMPCSSLLPSPPAAALAPVRRRNSSKSTVAPEPRKQLQIQRHGLVLGVGLPGCFFCLQSAFCLLRFSFGLQTSEVGSSTLLVVIRRTDNKIPSTV